MKLHQLARFASAVLISAAAMPMMASASTIIGASSVSATNSFPDATFGNANNLINQGGLATNYVSGVTNFDSYIASDPQHTTQSPGAEWFTNFNITTSTLIFDLGSVIQIDRVAAWVDEFWGAGQISIALSIDGVGFSSVGDFTPTDWSPSVASYGADIFAFSATSTRYVQLALSGCPQPLSVQGGGCGLGEVAFRSAPSSVPEPGSLALLAIAMGGAVWARRRRNK